MAKFEIPEKQVREMQQKGLEMLCYFDEFCMEHNLTYFCAADAASEQLEMKVLFRGMMMLTFLCLVRITNN